MVCKGTIISRALFLVLFVHSYAMSPQEQEGMNRTPNILKTANISNTNITEKLTEQCWDAIKSCSDNKDLLKLYYSLGSPCVAGVEAPCVNTTDCTDDDRRLMNRTECEEKEKENPFGKAMMKIKPKCKKIVGECLQARPDTKELMEQQKYCEVISGKVDVKVDDVMGDDVVSCLIETSRRRGMKNSEEREESEEDEDSRESEDSDEDKDDDNGGRKRRRRRAADDDDDSDEDSDNNDNDDDDDDGGDDEDESGDDSNKNDRRNDNGNENEMDCTMEEIFSLKDAAKCSAPRTHVRIVTLLIMLGLLLEMFA